MSHKHFIQVSSLGIVPTNLNLVMQKKYLHSQMFYVSNFSTLCFQSLDEHVLVQATEESICHRCEYSRISHNCVIVWEGRAVTNTVWIHACTRQVPSERESLKTRRSPGAPAQHRSWNTDHRDDNINLES